MYTHTCRRCSSLHHARTRIIYPWRNPCPQRIEKMVQMAVPLPYAPSSHEITDTSLDRTRGRGRPTSSSRNHSKLWLQQFFFPFSLLLVLPPPLFFLFFHTTHPLSLSLSLRMRYLSIQASLFSTYHRQLRQRGLSIRNHFYSSASPSLLGFPQPYLSLLLLHHLISNYKSNKKTSSLSIYYG